MYSLVSAPTVGFDLSRMDGGPATAALLEAMLAVPAAAWSAIAGRLPADTAARATARDSALRLAEIRPSVRDLGSADPAHAVGLLRHAPIGTLAGLLHCVRTDVLVPGRDDRADATDTAVSAGTPPEVVVSMATDAVCATYVRDLLSDADRRELAAGWLTARRHLPPAGHVELGPQDGPVRRLLGAVRSLRPADLPALTGAVDRMRASTGDWAAAMHSMTWAVHLSGRIRTAAMAQFRLVQAIDLAGVPVADRAAGAWNLLSGAVQALLVRDLADTESAAELLAPAVSGLGARWLLRD